MAQFALDRVLSVAGTYAADNTKKGITAGQIAFFCDQIVDPSLSFTAETEDVVDARNNVVMVLENGRGATFGASNAFFNTHLLAAQTGGKVDSATAQTITKYEVVDMSADGGRLSSLVYGYSNSGTMKLPAYKLNDDNSLSAVGATEAEVWQMTGGIDGKPAVHAIRGSGLSGKVLVVYETEISAGDAETIVALADGTNELMNVTAEVLLRDLCNEELYYAYILMKGKLSGETEWSMTRDGNHGFEIRCMPAYCESPRELVKVVIVKG